MGESPRELPEDMDPREDKEPGDRMVTPNETTVDVPIDDGDPETVSYTHLTLPTIYSV